jgi:hypothetical protein
MPVPLLRQTSVLVAAVLFFAVTGVFSGCKKETKTSERKRSKTALLIEAAAAGDLAAVQGLLDEGVDVNAKDEETEETPLHAAVGRGDAKMVRFLLERGADVDALAGEGFSPLHRAALTGPTWRHKINWEGLPWHSQAGRTALRWFRCF